MIFDLSVQPAAATTPWLAVLGDSANGAGHRTLAERAFGSLHDAIVSGRLRPGERLPIEEIAEALHMSAMPIREAVRRLDVVGLVESIPHRGARVTTLSHADLVEVYDARIALEPLAVRRAAERFDPEYARLALERLAVLNRFAGENRPETWAAHTRFHFALYEAADSQWLLRMIRPLWETSERYRIAVPVDPGYSLSSRQGEHEEILAACVAHDAERAARALRDHLATTANGVLRAMGGADVFERRTHCAK
jgi:DNA-binding GntR family transcriptional regulator